MRWASSSVHGPAASTTASAPISPALVLAPCRRGPRPRNPVNVTPRRTSAPRRSAAAANACVSRPGFTLLSSGEYAAPQDCRREPRLQPPQRLAFDPLQPGDRARSLLDQPPQSLRVRLCLRRAQYPADSVFDIDARPDARSPQSAAGTSPGSRSVATGSPSTPRPRTARSASLLPRPRPRPRSPRARGARPPRPPYAGDRRWKSR